MTIRLGKSIASLRAQRDLASSTRELTAVFERLSSGQRINKASDDPGGLAVADKLASDRRIFEQGSRNLNDGISLLSVADDTLAELSNIVVRLSELAEQAANGSYSNSQREALDTEAQALKKEFTRITRSTHFNDYQILTSDFNELRVQSGYGEEGGVASTLGGVSGTGAFTQTNLLEASTEISYESKLADFNGDGNLDLVSAGRDQGSSGVISVRLGNGDGTFGTDTKYQTVTARSRSVDVGDLNNDGFIDVVTSGLETSTDGELSIHLGNGDGTFQAATIYAAEEGVSYSITLVDLNNDGNQDVVTSGNNDSSEGYTTVRLGNGDGTLGAQLSINTHDGFTTDMQAADINNDGNQDLVTIGRDAAITEASVVVLYGSGDGTFGSSATFVMDGLTSRNIALADINGDDVLDIATVGDDGGGAGLASVRLGDGTGSFGASTSYAITAESGWGVLLNDVDGDGDNDLITSGLDAGYTGGHMSVLFNDGSGNFGDLAAYTAESNGSQSLTAGDINNDGVLDIISTGMDNSDGSAIIFESQTTNGVGPILPFSLATQVDALQALPIFARKLDQLSIQRGVVASFQARLEVGERAILNTTEHLQAAEASIRGADVAIDTAKLVKESILQDAATAILAQANQQPAVALALLQ